MFGFRKKTDHFEDLLEYMLDIWRMKPRYANAFLSMYRTDASVLLDQNLKRLDSVRSATSPDAKTLSSKFPDPRDFALVGQAYQAYKHDLHRGKHAGTDVEVAIWAILYINADLLSSVNLPLATYITTNQEEKFPNIFDEVFV